MIKHLFANVHHFKLEEVVPGIFLGQSHNRLEDVGALQLLVDGFFAHLKQFEHNLNGHELLHAKWNKNFIVDGALDLHVHL